MPTSRFGPPSRGLFAPGGVASRPAQPIGSSAPTRGLFAPGVTPASSRPDGMSRRPGSFVFELPDRPFRISGRPGLAPGPDWSFPGYAVGPALAQAQAPPIAQTQPAALVPDLPVTELAEAVLGRPKRPARGAAASRRRPVLLG